jgi:hypothetical protein
LVLFIFPFLRSDNFYLLAFQTARLYPDITTAMSTSLFCFLSSMTFLGFFLLLSLHIYLFLPSLRASAPSLFMVQSKRGLHELAGRMQKLTKVLEALKSAYMQNDDRQGGKGWGRKAFGPNQAGRCGTGKSWPSSDCTEPVHAKEGIMGFEPRFFGEKKLIGLFHVRRALPGVASGGSLPDLREEGERRSETAREKEAKGREGGGGRRRRDPESVCGAELGGPREGVHAGEGGKEGKMDGERDGEREG